MATTITPETETDETFIDRMSAADETPVVPAATPPKTPAKPATPAADTADLDGEGAAEELDETDDIEEGGEEDDEPKTGEDGEPIGDEVDAPGSEEDEDGDGLTPAAKELLTKHGIGQTLEDLPDEAREIVRTKLANIDKVVTRALQEATSFRKDRDTFQQEAATFRAEQRLAKENIGLYVASLLRANPADPKDVEAKAAIIAEVQGYLDDAANPRLARALDSELSVARGKALEAEQAEQKKLDDQRAFDAQKVARQDEMLTYLDRGAKKMGLPFDPSDEGDALVAAVVAAIRAKPEADRAKGLSERELDRIIVKQHGTLTAFAKAAGLRDAKNRIRNRTRVNAESTPAVRSGGKTPGPLRKALPKNDDDFLSQFAEKIGA